MPSSIQTQLGKTIAMLTFEMDRYENAKEKAIQQCAHARELMMGDSTPTEVAEAFSQIEQFLRVTDEPEKT